MASTTDSGGATSNEEGCEAIDVDMEVDTSSNQEAKEEAMRNMQPPPGYRRIPPPDGARSSIYDHGVRFEPIDDIPNKDKKLKWACACSASCRASSMKGQGALIHSKTNTGNITRHLSSVHGIVASKTKKRKQKQQVQQAAVSAHQAAALNSPDPGRIMMLLFVKVFIIGKLLAFSLAESPDVRLFFEVCAHALFPWQKMYSRMIKHYICELYHATVLRFAHRLKSAVGGAGGPILHANLDLWTSKTSNEKYIGLRLFWCTSKFVLDSALIAVKLFQPAAELSENMQLSDVLLVWVEEVLREFGLSPSDVFSTVTDAGSDVKRLCLKVLASEWEWCFPHMLNALVEAFGTTASRAACKNTAAREVVDAVKKVVEHLNKSNIMKVKYEDMQHLMFGKATKLVNAVPHRWISTCNVLEEIIRNWEALEKHYSDNEPGGIFPLAVHKTAIEELYSLIKPVAVVIKDSQRSDGPTGLGTYIDLCLLQSTTLDMTKALTITVPRKRRVGEDGPTTSTTKRMPQTLQEVTTATRGMLRDAILKRFFDRRFNEHVSVGTASGYVFEMAACVSPYFHKLQWLPKVCSSEKKAEQVRSRVWEKVVDLMTTMADGAGTVPEEQPDLDAPTPPNKRQRPAVLTAAGGGGSHKRNEALTQRMADSGLFGDESGDGSANGGPTKLTVREVCQGEFDRFRDRFKGAGRKDYPLHELLSFWAGEGQSLYPHMARVARVLLSVPASSAVLERDFSMAGRVITGSRSRLGGEYTEMTLFLNGNQDYIPVEVPVLSDEQAKQALPRRLTNPRAEVVSLSSGVEDVVADIDDDADGIDEYEAEADFVV